jgi:hypothetical protein
VGSNHLFSSLLFHAHFIHAFPFHPLGTYLKKMWPKSWSHTKWTLISCNTINGIFQDSHNIILLFHSSIHSFLVSQSFIHPSIHTTILFFWLIHSFISFIPQFPSFGLLIPSFPFFSPFIHSFHNFLLLVYSFLHFHSFLHSFIPKSQDVINNKIAKGKKKLLIHNNPHILVYILQPNK